MHRLGYRWLHPPSHREVMVVPDSTVFPADPDHEGHEGGGEGTPEKRSRATSIRSLEDRMKELGGTNDRSSPGPGITVR